MSKTDHLIEQQIIRHESCLKHVDELLERARDVGDARADVDPLLTALEAERDTLASLLQNMRGESAEGWSESADAHFGPMAVWNVMARLVERAIEKVEKTS